MRLCRPILQLDEPRNDVRTVAVAVELKKQRHACDHPENLKPDVAFTKARQINMPMRGALKKVAIPEQRIGMQINYKQRPV
jgi:hypothetical protein